MSARTVSVEEGPRLARSITVGPHTLTADEPQPISTDTGPTPKELLLAALGSCTSMTVRAFADKHSWPLDRVEVAARFDAQGQIVKNVQLTGDLEPDHIRQLLAVAGRCPVQRLLAREVSIVTVPTVLTRSRVSRSRTLPE
ncbi:OsmC family protein [Streptomyces sp. NPDC059837]|uniref:OsmC family protein n=1 Tax=unclassified Streptomyces TaxID=2593676 RepID=UPI0022571194|nr:MULTISPECIES: OsmC family protein [unclassified Streptomyces]MCX4403414.1 OsmC family protein [Streptomyces sp. NBC_01764]MCX5181611.1 OsmC family protein [Streptomyces sp. NBC_00268]